jgi:hypothetical protein
MHPLLGKYLEINSETTAVALQRRGKHPSTTIELLLETMLFVWSVPRTYLEENSGKPVSSWLKVNLLIED